MSVVGETTRTKKTAIKINAKIIKRFACSLDGIDNI